MVWARSTGLEIFNELSSVKALMMGRAGAGTNDANANIWTAFGNAVQSTNNGLAGIKVLSSLLQAEASRRFIAQFGRKGQKPA